MLRRLWDLAGLGTTARSLYEGGMLMKAILEFDMYEEKTAYEDAYNGTMYRAVLQYLDEWLDRWIKNPTYKDNDDVGKTLGEARDKLTELLNDYNVTLWD